MFEPGLAIALELIALSLGALVLIACHGREDTRLNIFPKFIGYFTIIISFIALIGSVIACFSYWMDAGGSVKNFGRQNSVPSVPADMPNVDIQRPPTPPIPPTPPEPTPIPPEPRPTPEL